MVRGGGIWSCQMTIAYQDDRRCGCIGSLQDAIDADDCGGAVAGREHKAYIEGPGGHGSQREVGAHLQLPLRPAVELAILAMDVTTS